MRVPLSWLRDYVPVEMPLQELADRLSVSSAVVAAIEPRGVADDAGNLDLFLVGRVLEAVKHPNADRLQLTTVDVGEGEPRSIVCGAWNFDAGATVAVALPGAILPNGLTLERRKVRGEVSDGMILAEDEVGLGEDHAGIMLLPEREPGTPLTDILPLREIVLDVEITGNRPDLLSVYGIAREIAALYELELGPVPGNDPQRAGNEPVEVQIRDPEGCPRYVGRLFRGVRVESSPVWLKARLLAAGMRPISNVVDVTNYVMLALGNPLHAFDFAKLGGGRILVRRAEAGEKLRTLDGVERALSPTDLMIADDERPVALAGIMGGEETEIGPETTDVLLEAANFEPFTIFRTSERLRLRTEGSSRWEKGVDPHLAPQAAVLATQLLVELTKSSWAGEIDAPGELPARPVVRFDPARADEVIGVTTPPTDQEALLVRLGFDRRDDSVVVPTWRARDVTREIDVVEEIARFRLDDVPFTLPERRAMFGTMTREQQLRRRVEDALAGLGFAEIYTPSLRPDEATTWRLPEPVSVDLAALRTSLLPSLVEVAERNVDAGVSRIALFEIARVYLPAGGDLPEERTRVAGIAEGPFAHAKGVVEALYAALKATPTFERAQQELLHPGKAARTPAGIVGELHPETLGGLWGGFELDLDRLFSDSREPVIYEDVITYPPVLQDLAFLVDEGVPAGDLAAAVREIDPLVHDVAIVEDYRGQGIPAGKKSVLLRVAFQSPDRTLSNEDAAALRERIIADVAERLGASLR